MRYWGWRPMLLTLWISVLVTACATELPQMPTQPPTSRPSLTLTLRRTTSPPTTTPAITAVVQHPTPVPTSTPAAYVVQPGDTWWRIAVAFGLDTDILQAANTHTPLQIARHLTIPLMIPTLHPLFLNILPPDCYTLPTEALLCLGRVTNDQTYPLSRIAVRVEAYRADGALIASQTAALEQRVLNPGESAPYRVLFEDELPDLGYLNVRPYSADPAVIDATTGLAIHNAESWEQDGRYRVSAVVKNMTTRRLERVRVVIVVYTVDKKVAGYRVIDLDALDVDEGRPIQAEIFPQLPAHNFTIYAEER